MIAFPGPASGENGAVLNAEMRGGDTRATGANLIHYPVYRTFDIQFESYTMAWILKGSAYLFMGKHQDTPAPEDGSHA